MQRNWGVETGFLRFRKGGRLSESREGVSTKAYSVLVTVRVVLVGQGGGGAGGK